MNYLWREPKDGDQIEPGDIIRLTSGGPEMMVTEINEHNVIASITSVSCCAVSRACVMLVRKATP